MYPGALNVGLFEVKLKQPVDPNAAEASGGSFKKLLLCGGEDQQSEFD